MEQSNSNCEKPEVVLDVASDDMHTEIEVQQTTLPEGEIPEFTTVFQMMRRAYIVGTDRAPRGWD